MRNKRVVIVGAGMGGLAAALKLVSEGLDVTVIERASGPGGKVQLQVINDRQFYTGPTVLTMPWIFDEIFGDVGANLADSLTLHRPEILARHAWSETERLDLFADHQRSAQAIGEFAGKAEAERFLQFCRVSERVYKALERPFILSPRTSPIGMFGRLHPREVGELLSIKALSSLWKVLGEYFRDPRIHQLFGRYATYVGSSPYLAPATLVLITHVESQGVCSVEGGIHRLPLALAELAERCGVTFTYNTIVKELNVERRRVTGVTLSNGERLDADAVIVNSDVSAIAKGLLGSSITHIVEAPPLRKRSHSVLAWNFAAKTHHFPLEYHNVFFPNDYIEEFQAIFNKQSLPAKPMVYLCAQDREHGKQVAGDQLERFLLVVNAPACGDQKPLSQSEIKHSEEAAFTLMRQCGLTFSEIDIVKITTPADFEHRFPASGGAIFGRASHGWHAVFERPGAKTPIAGLYLAGGSGHPGAGIPMAAISGRIAASELLQDIGVSKRDRYRRR